jgi:type II secretory pathway component PulF
MPSFAYKVRGEEGKLDRGLVVAASQAEALEKVRKLGSTVTVLELREVAQKAEKSKFSFGKKLSLKDRIIFTEQLSVMLNAGITLVQALKGLEEETVNKGLARILEKIIVDVEGGMPFSEALAKHPKAFSTIYCQMVKSAEKTGNLADILSKLTEQQQKEYELKGKVKGALIYPAIVSILLLAVMILVITFILPKLTAIFSESGVELPTSTKILLGISDIFVNQWWLIILGLLVLISGFKFMLRTERGLFFWDAFKIRIPVMGSFMKKAYMARFTQSFASLAQAGVPVLEVFRTLRGVIGNSVYEREIDKIANDVENGIKVSVAIRKSKHFPAMVGQLVSVGEQSGDLAGIFHVLGEFFGKEVDTMAKNLSTMLEPLIMVAMGVGIGFVLISVLQPIFNLTNAV